MVETTIESYARPSWRLGEHRPQVLCVWRIPTTGHRQSWMVPGKQSLGVRSRRSEMVSPSADADDAWCARGGGRRPEDIRERWRRDRKSTRLNSSHLVISY